MEQGSRLFLERRISLLYGAESAAMKAFDIVQEEMCAEKGFVRFDGSDYYMHCIDVANFLISYGVTNQNAVTAALLHDMVEDVPGFTTESISKHFGERVAEMVFLVSKREDLDYKDDAVLRGYLEDISKDIHAAAIKTADRMHNMCTLQGAELCKRYQKAVETEQYFVPFFKLCRERYPRYESLFHAARTQILPQIYEIKAHYHDYCELNKLKEDASTLH